MDTPLLAIQLLSLAGLIAATIEYGEIVRRRARYRALEAEQLALQDAGLRGVVRVFLADQ